jgi:hypothetical protein
VTLARRLAPMDSVLAGSPTENLDQPGVEGPAHVENFLHIIDRENHIFIEIILEIVIVGDMLIPTLQKSRGSHRIAR